MKKNRVMSFLRSMQFGMILLGLIAALSVIGTVVTQGQSAAYYEQVYGGMAKVILFCGFDHLYASEYYIALFAALCLNLLLCSVLRIGKLRGARSALLTRVRQAQPAEGMDADRVKALCGRMGFKQVGEETYLRRGMGLYGSFMTHTGMLLLVIAAAAVFCMERKEDAYVPIGETMTLADGCTVRADAFSMKDEEGRLDYISQITVTGRDGVERKMTTEVNAPARFDEHTVYQQSYAFSGVLDVQTQTDAPAEQVLLDGEAMISLDGVTGVYYMQVYGDYVRTEDGQMMPVQSREMKAPAYLIGIVTPQGQQMSMVLPDETFEVGGVYYTFRMPQAYPGWSVKTQPRWVTPVLYSSFAVLLLGLYLCFFHVPQALCLSGGKVRAAGGKDASELIEQLHLQIEETEE